MMRRPPRSTQSRSSAASDVYKRQEHDAAGGGLPGPPFLVQPFRLGTRCRIASDDVELLAHGPEVGRRPVDEHADREADAREGKHQWEDVEQHLLLLRHRPLQSRGRHVLLGELTPVSYTHLTLPTIYSV